jgi:hypothetical protein
MLRLVLPVLLAVLGAGAGIGAGLMLKPAPPPEEADADTASVEDPCGPAEARPAPQDVASGPAAGTATEYVKMNNQFVVPVMEGGEVAALVVLSLSLETIAGARPDVYAREPKLRDVFLQVLFDHANAGGFSGTFTSGSRLDQLRGGLLESARGVLGDRVIDVLVTDIARQDS